MRVKFETVNAGDIIDAYSGVKLLDVNQTIERCLTTEELKRYTDSLIKINRGEKINRNDLAVLDKVDAITYQSHGMCLKDSLVTKARLKACKRYGIQFNDRDGLVQHMHLFGGYAEDDEMKLKKMLGGFLLSILGVDGLQDLRVAIEKLMAGIELNNIDVIVLCKANAALRAHLDCTMFDDEIQGRIDDACQRYGFSSSEFAHQIH